MTIRFFLTFVLLNGLSFCAGSPQSSYGPIDISLLSGPASRGSLCEFELDDARQALFNIKKKLGAKALRDLFQSEIEQADDFWHKTIKYSAEGDHKVSDVTVEALVSPHVLNTTSFLQWLQTFASKGFPNRLIQGEPQHFFLEVNPPEVIESWGLIPVTHFTEAPSERKDFMEPLPEFPIQFFVTLNLRDGTLLADEIMALRDKPDGSGMQIRFVTYFPGALSESLTEDVRKHVAVELGNWMRFAYEDIVSGRFVPSLSLASRLERWLVRSGDL